MAASRAELGSLYCERARTLTRRREPAATAITRRLWLAFDDFLRTVEQEMDREAGGPGLHLAATEAGDTLRSLHAQSDAAARERECEEARLDRLSLARSRAENARLRGWLKHIATVGVLADRCEAARALYGCPVPGGEPAP